MCAQAALCLASKARQSAAYEWMHLTFKGEIFDFLATAFLP